MVIAAALLFAVNGTVSKVVLSSGISSVELTQVRVTGAFAGFALALLVARRAALRVRVRELPYLVVFGIAASRWCSGSTSSRSRGCRSGSRS